MIAQKYATDCKIILHKGHSEFKKLVILAIYAVYIRKPDLKIYLSKNSGASEYIRLGNLKSTMGKQSYEVPSGTDIEQFDFVHVWCEKYSVEFARAELK